MGQIILEMVWVGGFGDFAKISKLHEAVLEEANKYDLQDYITEVCKSSNGLVQFVIFPTGSKQGWPTSNNWEELVSYTALKSAGTSFSVKRVYIASN